MKTIKFLLIGIFSLFISVLCLRGVVISLNYITTDFTTTFTKEVYNFPLTFGIQAIILTAIMLIFIAIAVSSFQLTIKYYNKGIIERRNKELLNTIEDEKYNNLIQALRDTLSTDLKEVYIKEYLYGKDNIAKPNDNDLKLDIIDTGGTNVGTTNPNIKLEVKPNKATELSKRLEKTIKEVKIDKALYKTPTFIPNKENKA